MSDFKKFCIDEKLSPVQIVGARKAWQEQQAIIDEHTEVIKIQDADLRKYEKQIEGLKAQLNNMEACYIEKKKRVDELEGALNEVKEWKSHPAGYEASFGAWGVRDFYRGLAEEALRGANDINLPR